MIKKFSLNGGMINNSMKFANTCVTRDAAAAPATPYIGIKTKLSTTFVIAPTRVVSCTHLVFSSATIYKLLIAPKYEKDVYQTTSDNDGTASMYLLPYSNNMIHFADTVIKMQYATQIQNTDAYSCCLLYTSPSPRD